MVGPWRTRIAWLLPLAGLGLLVVLATRVSWSSLGSTLGEVAPVWLAVAILLAMVSVSLRALRLSVILGPHATFPQTWRSVCLGYFGSLFLPLGGGEIVKVAALNRQVGASVPRVGTALTVDRLCDFAMLLVLFSSVLGQGALRGLRAGPVLWFAVAGAGLVALLLFFLVSGNALRSRLLTWAGRHPGRHPWVHRFDEIHDQALALRRPILLATLGLLQAGIFAVDILASWCCLLAFPFGHGLPAAAPFRLAFFVMIAFGLPLLPGGFGSHQAATILALAPFGIGISQSLALSLAGEAAHLAALISLGLASIAGSRLNPLRLSDRTGVVDSPHPPEAP